MADFLGNKNDNSLTGTADADTIGGFGGNDILKGLGGIDFILGGSGKDLIEGGAGPDFMDGQDGTDTLSYSSSPAGVTIVLGNAEGTVTTASGGDAAGDSALHFENITGSAFSDRLTGNDFANVLKGGAGVDTLIGRAGKDTLKGGADNDLLIGGAGADIVDGGAGFDQLAYIDSTAGVRVILGKNGAETIGKGGEAQGDRISKVEDVYGSNYADRLTGNNLANGLSGNDGDDRLNGGGGNDTLNGGEDNDRLVGGKGNDELNGSIGNDAFVFGRGFGHDTIGDFAEGAGLGDVIRFDKDVFKNFSAVDAASVQVGADVVITKNADNTITIRNVTLADLNADDFSFF